MTTGQVHDGETLGQAKARWWYGIQHPWTRNPLARGRYGGLDFLAGHSTTNLYVTWTRENPRDGGHVIRYLVLALIGTNAAWAAYAIFAG